MDADSLIARIDRLLKSSTPPPDAVLEKCAKILEKARSGESPPPAADDPFKSSVASSIGASSSASAVTASSRTTSKTAASASTALALADADATDPLEFMSLQLSGEPNKRQEQMLQRHAKREIRPPVDIREKQTRQLQALLDGSGGKYVHADFVENGATQIGGLTSMTPSMTAGSIEGQFGRVTTIIGAAGPPRIRNLPSDFKLA